VVPKSKASEGSHASRQQPHTHSQQISSQSSQGPAFTRADYARGSQPRVRRPHQARRLRAAHGGWHARHRAIGFHWNAGRWVCDPRARINKRRPPLPIKILGLPRNVIENKGQEIRKVRIVGHARNLIENRQVNYFIPGMLLILNRLYHFGGFGGRCRAGPWAGLPEARASPGPTTSDSWLLAYTDSSSAYGLQNLLRLSASR
jgi:hypothetical protein